MGKVFAAVLLVMAILIVGCAQKEGTAISADGVSIKFSVKGKGTPVLVFVHGLACNQGHWDAQAPYFSKRYKVVTIDLAGHGGSGRDREAYTMQAFGKDVVAVINKLGLEQVILMGHSMGGPVILEATRLMPDNVIGLIPVDIFKNVEQILTQEQIEKALAPLRVDFFKRWEEWTRVVFVPTSDNALVERRIAEGKTFPPDICIAAYEGYLNYVNADIKQALQEVKPPICCINSDKDPTNVDAARRYAKSFKVKYVPGVGHFPNWEAPEEFNRLLEETVAEFAATAASK